MISEYNSVKETLRDLLKKSGEDIDLCEYFPDLLGGIGHNELRHFWIARTEKSKQNPTMFTIQKRGKIATSRMCGKR